MLFRIVRSLACVALLVAAGIQTFAQSRKVTMFAKPIYSRSSNTDFMLTATVTSGQFGSIAYYDGPTLIASAPVRGGQAQPVVTTLQRGTRLLRGVYSSARAESTSTSDSILVAVGGVGGNSFRSTSFLSGGSVAASGDLDADGNVDLIEVTTLSSSTGQTYGGIAVQLGNGDGTFRNPITYPVTVGLVTLVAADINCDGNLDVIALGDSEGQGTITTFLGDGTGALHSNNNQISIERPFYEGPGAPLAVADVNQDGYLDILVSSLSGITLLVNTGNGTFETPRTIEIPGGSAFVSVADLNRDGRSDLVSANGSVSILIGNGDGTFRPPVAYKTSSDVVSVAVADYDQDGIVDLALTCNLGVTVWRGFGDGTFEVSIVRKQIATLAFPTGGLTSVATARLGAGLQPDLIVATCQPTQFEVDIGYNTAGDFTPGGVYILPRASLGNRPLGCFQPAVAIADFNNDGRLDIAVGSIILFGRSKPVSNTTLAISSDSSRSGQVVNLAVTVTPQGEDLAGFITIFDNDEIIGTVRANTGFAEFEYRFNAGEHLLTASFDGNQQFAASQSNLINLHTVRPARRKLKE